jgi:RNA-directed DNA polymerase
MKKVKRLWEDVITLDNVQRAYVNARRGKRHRPDVIAYAAHLKDELSALQEQLYRGRVKVGDYHFFKIFDPKEPRICASPFRERVLHHALMNVCEPVFERFLIHDTYACRRGKGRLAAIAKAKQHVRRYGWYAKMDVRHYFETLPHAGLKERLRRLFADGKVLAMLEQIIRSYATEPGRGLPIGNLTSQHFANFYLGYLDRYVKETLKVKPYLRYMDDFVLWADSRAEVVALAADAERFVSHELDLQLKPVVINRTTHGMDFLGFRLFPDRTKLTARNKQRFIRRTRELCSPEDHAKYGEDGIAQRLTAWCAFLEQADTLELRRKVFSRANDWLDSFS